MNAAEKLTAQIATDIAKDIDQAIVDHMRGLNFIAMGFYCYANDATVEYDLTYDDIVRRGRIFSSMRVKR